MYLQPSQGGHDWYMTTEDENGLVGLDRRLRLSCESHRLVATDRRREGLRQLVIFNLLLQKKSTRCRFLSLYIPMNPETHSDLKMSLCRSVHLKFRPDLPSMILNERRSPGVAGVLFSLCLSIFTGRLSVLRGVWSCRQRSV